MCKLLIKFPTRGRAEKFFKVLDLYFSNIEDIENTFFVINCDIDDMNNENVRNRLCHYKNLQVYFVDNKSKVKAINNNIANVDFDILLLSSDDMIPQVFGFDTIVRTKMNEKVVIQNEMGDFSGTFWRFIPISDEDVDVAISRDCDSRLSIRERLAVDEWLNSDKLFHIMRDHPWHCTEILGGMWGVRAPLLKKDMRNLVIQHNKGAYYQVDQDFLRSIIYPLVKDNSFVHDEFFEYNVDKRKFPSERVGQMFVGEIFDEFESPILEHRRLLDKNVL